MCRTSLAWAHPDAGQRLNVPKLTSRLVPLWVRGAAIPQRDHPSANPFRARTAEAASDQFAWDRSFPMRRVRRVGSSTTSLRGETRRARVQTCGVPQALARALNARSLGFVSVFGSLRVCAELSRGRDGDLRVAVCRWTCIARGRVCLVLPRYDLRPRSQLRASLSRKPMNLRARRGTAR